MYAVYMEKESIVQIHTSHLIWQRTAVPGEANMHLAIDGHRNKFPLKISKFLVQHNLANAESRKLAGQWMSTASKSDQFKSLFNWFGMEKAFC